MPRTRWTARVGVPLVAAVLLGMTPLGGVASAAVAAPRAPVPKAKAFGPYVDEPAGFERESTCDPVEKPGARALRTLLRRTYGAIPASTVRACSRADSGHEEGRAVDWMVSARVPAQRAMGDAFVAWLQAPDALGNPAAMARRLGVSYVIWRGRLWHPSSFGGEWREYSGCLHGAKRKRPADNTCHRTHVHISLSWDGAYQRTSYFGRYAACPASPPSWPAYPVAADGLGPVALPPTRLLGTASGTGSPVGPCRLHGDRELALPVLGVGGVPLTGVADVVLQVTLLRPDTPMSVWAWPTGTARPVAPVLTVGLRGTATAQVTVPVGTGGAVSLQVDGGVSHAVVDVLGYDNAVVTPVPPVPPLPEPL